MPTRKQVAHVLDSKWLCRCLTGLLIPYLGYAWYLGHLDASDFTFTKFVTFAAVAGVLLVLNAASEAVSLYRDVTLRRGWLGKRLGRWRDRRRAVSA